MITPTAGEWKFVPGPHRGFPAVQFTNGQVQTINAPVGATAAELESNARLMAAAKKLHHATRLAAQVMSGDALNKSSLINALEACRDALEAVGDVKPRGPTPKKTKPMLQVFGGTAILQGNQVRCVIAARSWSEAHRLLQDYINVSYSHIRDYWSITGNSNEVEAAQAKPGVPLWTIDRFMSTATFQEFPKK